jgi:hypothetical protein
MMVSVSKYRVYIKVQILGAFWEIVQPCYNRLTLPHGIASLMGLKKVFIPPFGQVLRLVFYFWSYAAFVTFFSPPLPAPLLYWVYNPEKQDL